MNVAYIGMGTNLGDREGYLKGALQELASNPSNQVLAVSSIYETDPWGYVEQGKFLNMVICLQTELTAQELLTCCMQVEKELGRKREIRWGPRTIDLDILLYNQENIVTENLIIPHPRIMERAFVAIPLVEIDKDITLPNMDKPVREVMDDIPDKKGVRVWKQKDGEGVFGPFEN